VSSSSIVSSCPNLEVSISAVVPSTVAPSTLAPFSSRVFAHRKWPNLLANRRADQCFCPMRDKGGHVRG